MIGSIRGQVTHRRDPYILIEAYGVGYKVLAAASVLTQLQTIGQDMHLFIYSHIREDAFDLYGFLENEDLALFEQLLGVSGIGPKTAMHIFSFGSRLQIVSAIAAEDVEFFTNVPRLGRKNAQKIIIELRGKITDSQASFLNGNIANEDTEVAEALKGFGFSIKEAQEALRMVAPEGKSVSEKIRLCLKYLGK